MVERISEEEKGNLQDDVEVEDLFGELESTSE